jgi:uncharacterized protein
MNDPLKQPIITEAFACVQKALLQNGGEFPSNELQSFRRRSQHIERVTLWCKSLMKKETGLIVDPAVVYYSALFHDAGYNHHGIPHEELGADIFLRFAREHKFPDALALATADIILHHSCKESLYNPKTSIEQILVMEADLLDEEGAFGIVIDCMAFAKKNSHTDGIYSSLLEYLRQYAGEILHYSPMVTPYAANCWQKKQEIIKMFLKDLEDDLFYHCDRIDNLLVDWDLSTIS